MTNRRKVFSLNQLPGLVELESNEVKFDNNYVLGNTSPRTGNITFDFTGEQLGAVSTMRHNAATVPTFPSEGVVISGEYKINQVNYIWFCLTKITGGRIVQITIGQ